MFDSVVRIWPRSNLPTKSGATLRRTLPGAEPSLLGVMACDSPEVLRETWSQVICLRCRSRCPQSRVKRRISRPVWQSPETSHDQETCDTPPLLADRGRGGRLVPTSVKGYTSAEMHRLKLPADPFASAQDFSRALSDPGFGHREEGTVGVAEGQSQWTPLAVATTVSTAVLALALGWWVFRPEPPQPVSRQVLSTEGWAGLAGEVGRLTAVAPDGSSMILPIDVEEEGGQLALKMRGSTEVTPIPGTEGGRDVVYSPDGQWIAYAVGNELFKRPKVGGSRVRLAEDTQSGLGSVAAVDWLDDGTILYEQFVGGGRKIVRISENRGEPVVVFEPQEGVSPVWVRGLPNARGALVVGCPAATCPASQARLYIVDLEDLSWDLAFEQVLRAWYAPTGHIVYVRTDGALFAQPPDLASLELTGSAIPLFEGVRATGGGTSDFADIVLGADGTRLYVEGPAVGIGIRHLHLQCGIGDHSKVTFV